MDNQCLSITIVTGSAPKARQADIVASLNGNRAVAAKTSPLENGDVMFVKDMSGLELIASNVLLTGDRQAPVFSVVDYADL